MKNKFFKAALLFFILFAAAALYAGTRVQKYAAGMEAGAKDRLVLLNEIEQLTTDEEGYNPAYEEIGRLKNSLHETTAEVQGALMRRMLAFFVFFTAACLLICFTYLYIRILRPFYKLEKYAGQIAGGDLEISLEYERGNFFGAFTWAFDHMRKEILTARKNEAQAVRENKTIIATLSHDIKTPVASIRAYAEGLEASLEADYEMRERYLKVIMRKCDEVSGLVNDLVLHSLSELERLEIKEQKISMRAVLEETLRDLEDSRVVLCQPIPDAEICADDRRVAQVISNLLENAGKYAPKSRIDVRAFCEKGRYEIHIRDYGDGILPEDMPFVTQKFYRGKNVGDKPGSGLGLYIVSYIMEKMKGGLILENHSNGLEAVLWLPLTRQEA